MPEPRIVTVHLAGHPQMGGLYQTCPRCGYILQDFTGSGVVVVDVATDPAADTTLPTWPEGERIGVFDQAGGATQRTPQFVHDAEVGPSRRGAEASEGAGGVDAPEPVAPGAQHGGGE